METGCYTLDLYCDNVRPISYVMDYEVCPPGHHRALEFPHQFMAELGSTCRANARKKGWVFKKFGRHACPRCSGKR